MSKRDKLRRKLRNNPAAATMQEVETLLTQFGFILARISGSHHIYEFDDGQRFRQIVVPLHGHKIKKVYVRQVSDILDELFPEMDGGEDREENPNDESA